MFYPALLQISWAYNRAVRWVSGGCRVEVDDEMEEIHQFIYNIHTYIYIYIHTARVRLYNFALYVLYRVMGDGSAFILCFGQEDKVAKQEP